MTILLHTADWHLGKSFFRFAEQPEVQFKLKNARLEAIDRLGEVAREVGAAAILVAGDVFHTSDVPDQLVVKALEHIGKLQLPVIAIPGNHDHAGTGTLWRRESFLQHRDTYAPNLECVIDGPACIAVEDVDVLAAPTLQRMHGQSIAALGALPSRPGCARVGLAHGAKDHFTEDDQSRALDLARHEQAHLAYLALGDYHRQQRVEGLHCESWYAGTHEPDAFPSHHQEGERIGGCMIVEFAQGAFVRATPRALPGGVGWVRLVRAVQDDAALDCLEAELRQLAAGTVQQTLISLDLAGSRLSFASSQRLTKLCKELSPKFLHLEQCGDIAKQPSEAELAELEGLPGLVGETAKSLLSLIQDPSQDPAQAAVAREALAQLHAHVQAGAK